MAWVILLIEHFLGCEFRKENKKTQTNVSGSPCSAKQRLMGKG